MTAPLLQAHALAVGYPGREVGAQLDIGLSGGEVLALLGPNGCGKTTLLKTLLGLLPARSGQIRLNGEPLETHDLAARARLMAYVPQSQHATFGFSAIDMVLMGRTAHQGLLARPGARDRAVAGQALERMGVAHLAQQSVHRISGGERQLVLIARALAQEPRAVLLDEPTASLDFGNQGRVMRAIRELAAEGLAVLFTTHDPNHALRYADRAALMRDGSFLAHGPVREVIHRDALCELYRTRVEAAHDPLQGFAVFLPGG